jgi:hypothetical protein
VSGGRRAARALGGGGLLLALVGATAAPLSAADGKGFYLSAGGGLAAGTLSWQTHTSYELYKETATLDVDQKAGSGPAFEGAVGYRFSPRFGLHVAFGWSRRDVTTSLQASLPHPLYLDRPRSVSAEVGALKYRETDVHFDLEWIPVRGAFELALFAGSSLVQSRTDVVEKITVSEEYPYDEATFQSTSLSDVKSDSAFGWNVGGSAAFPLGSRFALGAQARYTGARTKLKPTEADAFTLDAGGLTAIGFLRVRF